MFGLPAVYIITGVLWPLPWLLPVKLGVAVAVLVADRPSYADMALPPDTA